jgi:hypothetical protein
MTPLWTKLTAFDNRISVLRLKQSPNLEADPIAISQAPGSKVTILKAPARFQRSLRPFCPSYGSAGDRISLGARVAGIARAIL